MSRYPNLLTDRLRHIIQRDTIITVGIITPLSGLGLLATSQDLDPALIYAGLFALLFFILFSIFRLFNLAKFGNRPLLAIVMYIVFLVPVTSYVADLTSFYNFIWMLPIFIANFFYGKGKVLYAVFAALAINNLIIKPLGQGAYLESIGKSLTLNEYVYVVSEMCMIIALSMLFINTQVVTKEDRETLLNSLEKAEYESKRLQSLTNTLTDAIIATDSEGRITDYNSAALNLLDTNQDMLQQEINTVLRLTDNTQDKPVDVLEVMRAHSIDYQTNDYTIKYQSGEVVYVSASFLPVHTNDPGNAKGYLLVLRDITKERTLEEEQKTFISLVSHELRTPIAANEGLISNVEFYAKESHSDEKLVTLLHQAHNQTLALEKIVGTLDAFIEASLIGKNVNNSFVNMKELFGSVRSEAIVSRAEKHGVVVEIECADDFLLNIDAGRLHKILVILLDNALKYTESGSITLSANRTDKQATISVRDSGAGMDKLQLKDLFKPFHQKDDFQRRADTGTGLGLFIAKRYADSIDATIKVVSEPQKGSTFSLIFDNKML